MMPERVGCSLSRHERLVEDLAGDLTGEGLEGVGAAEADEPARTAVRVQVSHGLG